MKYRTYELMIIFKSLLALLKSFKKASNISVSSVLCAKVRIEISTMHREQYLPLMCFIEHDE